MKRRGKELRGVRSRRVHRRRIGRRTRSEHWRRHGRRRRAQQQAGVMMVQAMGSARRVVRRRLQARLLLAAPVFPGERRQPAKRARVGDRVRVTGRAGRRQHCGNAALGNKQQAKQQADDSCDCSHPNITAAPATVCRPAPNAKLTVVKRLAAALHLATESPSRGSGMAQRSSWSAGTQRRGRSATAAACRTTDLARMQRQCGAPALASGSGSGFSRNAQTTPQTSSAMPASVASGGAAPRSAKA